MRDIKLVMGYKPDLTIEHVMEIFKEKFDYEMKLDEDNSFFILKEKAIYCAKVILIHKKDKTILKINDAFSFTATGDLLITILGYVLGAIFAIISFIVILAVFPFVRKFMKPIEDFAKNHPEFK